MTIVRSHQISLQDTPCYYMISCCVRRAFLRSEDTHSGQSYGHRRPENGRQIGTAVAAVCHQRLCRRGDEQ